MYIKRIVVEEGFLEGLDLEFTKGLNVLIGARGSGKTSVLELLRFCLGAQSTSEKSKAKAQKQVNHVLKTGKVAVTVQVGNKEIVVTRSIEDGSWKSTGGKYTKPLVFAQNEIETIGLHDQSKLDLIDGFREYNSEEDEELESAHIQIRSLSKEIEEFSSDVDDLISEIDTLKTAPEDLKQALALQKEFLETIGTSTLKEQNELDKVGQTLTTENTKKSILDKTKIGIERWMAKLNAASSTPPEMQKWPIAEGEKNPLLAIKVQLQSSKDLLDKATSTARECLASLNLLCEENTSSVVRLEDLSRDLRRHLEGINKGAGEHAKNVATAKEKNSKLSVLSELKTSKLAQMEDLQTRRGLLLDELDKIRSARFSDRNSIAKKMNSELGPKIRIQILEAAMHSDYINVISAALRGSNLHYNVLAPQIAKKMSPRELVEAAEFDDGPRIAEALEIEESRGYKIATNIREYGTENILLAKLDDQVSLKLLDGKDYKLTEHLSMGQRCTVILPILLGTQKQPLIVDQPEDHLDNAFIVQTLIKALLKRKEQGQMIFSTHNANIPVLGEAEKVIKLSSDGENGFVECEGDLDDDRVVDSITTVMEGGIEAFQKRAKFYQRWDV